MKTYCKNANRNLGGGVTPVKLLCDALPQVDTGIDFLQQKDILFMPSAVFPRGNTITVPGTVLQISPGSSTVNDMFTIENDLSGLRITRFDVFPFDPAPNQNYNAIVAYECYTNSLVVTMSIVGTDSYEDTVFCNTGPSCTLHVPGAEALVQDTIMVTARDASTTITRRITIIF